MARPNINLPVPLKRPTPFKVPKVYVPYTVPGYQPAWSTATLVDANLVLEGGAMRGQFTAGVLDFLMDNGLMPKHVIGVSAGALNGLNYVAGSRGRTCYLNTKYCNDWRYLSMRSFATTGNAFNPDFSFDKIPNELDPFDYDSYHASPLTLTTVASNLELGEADYHQMTDLRREMDYLRASASMPLVSKIVKINNKLLLDGGICDSIPLGYAQTLGATKHIVVLTQDATYEKSPNRLMPLIRRKYAAYPLFTERMEHRHFEYNRCYRQLAQMHEAGEVFVIRPPEPVAIASMEHDSEKLYNLWKQGYDEARRHFPALRRYLALDSEGVEDAAGQSPASLPSMAQGD